MSFISMKFDDCETELVPEGEYNLRIIKTKEAVSKQGNPMTIALIRVEDAAVGSLPEKRSTFPSPR